MTKKDLKSVAVGGAVGLGFFLGLWYLLRRTKQIPVLNPVTVRWEGSDS